MTDVLVTIGCLLVFAAFAAGVLAFVPGKDKPLSDYDQHTEALFERMWQLRHPGWLTTRLRLQLAALHALIPAMQLLDHQLPLVSPAGSSSPDVPAGDAPGPARAAPPGAHRELHATGPGARPPWEQHHPGQPTAPTHHVWGDTTGHLDYADAEPFTDWLRDSIVMDAIKDAS